MEKVSFDALTLDDKVKQEPQPIKLSRRQFLGIIGLTAAGAAAAAAGLGFLLTRPLTAKTYPTFYQVIAQFNCTSNKGPRKYSSSVWKVGDVIVFEDEINGIGYNENPFSDDNSGMNFKSSEEKNYKAPPSFANCSGAPTRFYIDGHYDTSIKKGTRVRGTMPVIEYSRLPYAGGSSGPMCDTDDGFKQNTIKKI